MIKIGVVGPEESVSKILIVAEEFNDVTCIPFIYDNVEEIGGLIETSNIYINQWLFSGVMNHSYATQNHLINPKIANYPMLHGSSFFESLIRIQQKEEKLFKSISIDTIQREEMEKVLSFYGMNHLNFELSPFFDYKNSEKLTLYHKKLYKENKTEVAITAIRSVYNSLVKDGIPTFRLTPSYLSIKLTIRLLIEKSQANHYKSLQLAVVGCKAFNVNDYIENSIFDWKANELHLKSSLLDLTKKLSGSFIEPADGLYYIFTTKGEISERIEDELFDNIDFLKIQHQMDVGFSIGFGDTVFLAEQHARYGLNQLTYDENPTLLVVKNKQDIEQRSKRSKANNFDITKMNTYLEKKFKGSNVNINDIIRISLYAHKHNTQHFTVEDIAGWLHGTKRNARRILSDLEKAGVIEVFDKVKTTSRGRPSNRYRLLNRKLLPERDDYN